MKLYRKKPVEVEAEPWYRVGDVPEANITQYDGNGRCAHCGNALSIHGSCPTLEGEHIVCPGDWIIKGIQGEFYPVKPDIFFETYEKV